MQLRNTDNGYGAVARGFHWLLALLLGGLFALGWYMTGLDYYHPWYRVTFDTHKAVGLAVLLLALLRLAWALADRTPALEPSLRRWERMAARATHGVLYALTVLVPVSGYLLSTARGDGIDVFGLFTVPALLPPRTALEELSGRAHYLLAFGGAWLVLLHAAAALKHHFLDRDATLARMLGRRPGTDGGGP